MPGHARGLVEVFCLLVVFPSLMQLVYSRRRSLFFCRKSIGGLGTAVSNFVFLAFGLPEVLDGFAFLGVLGWLACDKDCVV